MATNSRRKRKNHETTPHNGTKVDKWGNLNQKTVGDVRNASKSQAQMKKDWGNK